MVLLVLLAVCVLGCCLLAIQVISLTLDHTLCFFHPQCPRSPPSYQLSLLNSKMDIGGGGGGVGVLKSKNPLKISFKNSLQFLSTSRSVLD